MCTFPISVSAVPSCYEELRLIPVALDSVQVNIPAESGEMGVLASHVPSIEQLKPGLVEVIEESGGSKQFFRAYNRKLLCTALSDHIVPGKMKCRPGLGLDRNLG